MIDKNGKFIVIQERQSNVDEKSCYGCFKHTEVYQFGLCKSCLAYRHKHISIPLINKIRGLSNAKN